MGVGDRPGGLRDPPLDPDESVPGLIIDETPQPLVVHSSEIVFEAAGPTDSIRPVPVSEVPGKLLIPLYPYS